MKKWLISLTLSIVLVLSLCSTACIKNPSTTKFYSSGLIITLTGEFNADTNLNELYYYDDKVELFISKVPTELSGNSSLSNFAKIKTKSLGISTPPILADNYYYVINTEDNDYSTSYSYIAFYESAYYFWTLEFYTNYQDQLENIKKYADSVEFDYVAEEEAYFTNE